MSNIIVQVDDHSPEVLAALENAIERGAMAIGGKAVEYAVDNLKTQKAWDTGRLAGSITYMVKDE